MALWPLKNTFYLLSRIALPVLVTLAPEHKQLQGRLATTVSCSEDNLPFLDKRRSTNKSMTEKPANPTSQAKPVQVLSEIPTLALVF